MYITGTVRNEVGKVVEGAKVSGTWHKSGDFVFDAPTGPGGTYIYENTEARGHEGKQLKVRVTYKDYWPGEKVEVVLSDPQHTVIDIDLKRPTRIWVRGTVRIKADQQPLANVRVKALLSERLLFETTTDAKGEFSWETNDRSLIGMEVLIECWCGPYGIERMKQAVGEEGLSVSVLMGPAAIPLPRPPGLKWWQKVVIAAAAVVLLVVAWKALQPKPAQIPVQLTIAVPTVVGLTEAQADEVLAGAHLTVNPHKLVSTPDKANWGKVMGSTPPATERVEEGSGVTLEVWTAEKVQPRPPVALKVD
jgi:hypothetical protein